MATRFYRASIREGKGDYEIFVAIWYDQTAVIKIDSYLILLYQQHIRNFPQNLLFSSSLIHVDLVICRPSQFHPPAATAVRNRRAQPHKLVKPHVLLKVPL